MRAIIDFRVRVFASFSKCNQHMDLQNWQSSRETEGIYGRGNKLPMVILHYDVLMIDN